MSRVKRGKGKPKGGSRAHGNTFEADENVKMVFSNFMMINENSDIADLTMYNEDDYHEFFILSCEWIRAMEDHVKGKGPYPAEPANSNLLDESRHNENDRVFKWGSKRAHYNHILRSKLKFKKDYVICNPAAWEYLIEEVQVVPIKRKFSIEKSAFHAVSMDFEVVVFFQ